VEGVRTVRVPPRGKLPCDSGQLAGGWYAEPVRVYGGPPGGYVSAQIETVEDFAQFVLVRVIVGFESDSSSLLYNASLPLASLAPLRPRGQASGMGRG
jgi:hypothetical protein